MTETAGLARALQRATMRFDPNTLREYVDDTESLWAIREEMTARFPTLHLDVDRARLLGLKVVASRLLGDFEAAMSDGKQALELAESTGRDLLIAPARARLARVHAWRQEFEEADRLFAMAEAGELPRGLIASVRLHAGLSCIAQGRLIEALIHLERALDDSSGDEWFTSIAEYALDASHRRAGAYGFGPRPRSWAERAGHPAPRPFRDRDTGRYGFKDAEGRAVIVSAFERVGDFRGGVATVQRNGLWGAITREGRTVVPFLYDEMRTEMPDGRSVEGFVDGVVGVDRRGGKGAVDRTGRLVVPPHYRQVVCHPGGFAVCSTYGQWGAIDRDGQEILPERYRKEQVLSRLESFIVVDNGPL
ncbi:hypothetical protein Afil01_48150 [Actinorhabdospora filicis]|uniref:WG repeat-containing protein n=1 Tax=Actinorhabdospora filicis TaxID=1785913 RepID=A0A9W6SQ04_9ACTN|nr:WG repeat-containing protein [Actinorhabdospora filicis]GLZ80008.1 hypothetical protein Afil01_48150 [Actinorhabdospora filicis]